MALGLVAVVVGGGTLGYWVLGLAPIDALYQTVTTVSTVGFRELFIPSRPAKVFTIVLILAGVGTVLYAFSVILEALIEGQLAEMVGRRRMERTIEGLSDHVIVCGWGRLGRAIGANLASAGQKLLVVDLDAQRLVDSPHPTLVGDATDDAVLRRAGIDRARALAAVTSTDATNLYLTLSGRSLAPELFIVARARLASSEDKLHRAGADRVINPQAIGGARAAAFLLQPHVAEFVDVIVHGIDVEFRLSEVAIPPGSELAGRSLRDGHLRDRTGALVLALRRSDGRFITNPSPETTMDAGHILIAIGTAPQLESLSRLATGKSFKS